MSSILADIEFFVQPVHQCDIDENQNHEGVDWALLRKPEAKLEPANMYGVELVDKQYAEPERDDKPNHQQTDEVVQCLKLISRPGCEKIVRYAFEYAKQYKRKKVTCFTKDNIMKQTDGLFHQVFDEIAAEYPEIENEHWIVDIGAAKVADTPEHFDVVVMANLYGDIISDIAAQITGSVGLAGSSNIGEECAMFEAIHGSAPDIAGKNIANPFASILSAAMMLETSFGMLDEANAIRIAVEKCMNAGFVTSDINNGKLGTEEVGDKVAAFIAEG